MKNLLIAMIVLLGVGCQESHNSQVEAGEEGYAVVIGKDDRAEVMKTSAKTSPVGALEARDPDGTTSNCTGTLIADDLVLTAAHCAYSENQQTVPVSILFKPDIYSNKSSQDYYVVEKIYMNPGYVSMIARNEGMKVKDAMNDIAIVKLKTFPWQKPAGQKYGKYELMTTPGSGTAMMIGYPADKPADTKWIQENCKYQPYAGLEVISFECDTFEGSSGSGILSKDSSGQYKIVGVNSAELPQVMKNLAVPMTSTYFNSINAIINGQPDGVFVEKEIQSDMGSTFSVLNRCKSEINVAVKYRSMDGRWTTSRWMRVPAKNQVQVIDRMVDPRIMWIAESKNSSWTSDEVNAPDMNVDGEAFKAFVLTIPSNNQYTLSLTCD